MHHVNNAVVMQTKQLGWTEALEEELRSSRGKMVELEQKLSEQDQVITQLVGDNLDHLQDNTWLTVHINSSQERMAQMEHQLLSRRWYILHYHRSTLLLPLGERLLLVVVEWRREAK